MPTDFPKGRNSKAMNKHSSARSLGVRITAFAVAVLLLAGIVFSSVYALAETSKSEPDRYDLNIDVLFDEQVVRVTQTLDYTNRTGHALEQMYFCVYANILRRQTDIPVESDRFDDAFPQGYAPGGVDFMNVEFNGERAEWGVQGDSELFLRVACDLENGERGQFRFDFYVLLSVYSGAMGTGDLTWRLTNFYPVAAVWDEYLEDFPLNGYTAMNEPLYSECADYHITLSLPETYHLASAGHVTARPDGEGMVHYEIEAPSIREATLIFSRKMTERTGSTVRGTAVRALANTASAADALLQSALSALNDLEEKFFVYPWERLTLIETEYLYGGLSHPCVIQVSGDLCGLFDRDALEETVYNLCTKQYTACIAGVNPNGAPWLIDGLASYITLLRHTDGSDDSAYLAAFNRQILPSLQITIPGGVTVDSESERFSSRMEYELVAVDRACVILHDMRQGMGHKRFWDALREYLRRTAMKNASASDFLAVMNEVSGRRWDEYLYGQMHNMNDFVGQGIEGYE